MRINEIFYSLQGEGSYTGYPCVFVRFSGCNQHCDFCDTTHEPCKVMTEDEVVEAIVALSKNCTDVVLTGGEPTLQLTRTFVQKLDNYGYSIHIETNGSMPIPKDIARYISWVTISPKALPVVLTDCDELKLVYGSMQKPEDWERRFPTALHYLQPLDARNEKLNAANLVACIDYIKQHPKWKLSLQTQKILRVR
ncbi:MAG: 7-carboxy-7-deazaguanine synthase QueE [Bacteroidales bacterium]|nr:7-carboxy-7-deazaguanine synthase QueE [Bacteroidales bacterium]